MTHTFHQSAPYIRWSIYNRTVWRYCNGNLGIQKGARFFIRTLPRYTVENAHSGCIKEIYIENTLNIQFVCDFRMLNSVIPVVVVTTTLCDAWWHRFSTLGQFSKQRIENVNMPFWDYVHIGRPAEERQQYRNLQEGLLQIASQTCNILVQVNNTNNISYGNNATNVQYNNYSPSAGGSRDEAGCSNASGSRRTAGGDGSDADVEQSVVLIPSTSFGGSIRGSTKNLFSHYKHRLSVSVMKLSGIVCFWLIFPKDSFENEPYLTNRLNIYLHKSCLSRIFHTAHIFNCPMSL